ncbi:MAG: hypothetical protein WBZ37_10645, partial [Mycobacterium sp.]
SGSINTGSWNSGNANTGFGFTTDTGATTSGFGNTGTDVSGFNNTASGARGPLSVNGDMSGFNNHASGGHLVDGEISGLFNTGVTGPLTIGGVTFPSGEISGVGSGLFNSNTGFSGLFNIDKLAG